MDPLMGRKPSVDDLPIIDVRHVMPNYDPGRREARRGEILGIALHHSGTADPRTGLSTDNARSIAEYHIHALGWDHPGYHFVVLPNGVIEYSLDEGIPAFHAGFIDPADTLGLEKGQFWNEHYLAICVVGWFDTGRTFANGASPGDSPIPDYFTRPPAAQMKALVGLVRSLQARYSIAPKDVRGHRELKGCATVCPGSRFDLESFRRSLAGL